MTTIWLVETILVERTIPLMAINLDVIKVSYTRKIFIIIIRRNIVEKDNA